MPRDKSYEFEIHTVLDSESIEFLARVVERMRNHSGRQHILVFPTKIFGTDFFVVERIARGMLETMQSLHLNFLETWFRNPRLEVSGIQQEHSRKWVKEMNVVAYREIQKSELFFSFPIFFDVFSDDFPESAYHGGFEED